MSKSIEKFIFKMKNNQKGEGYIDVLVKILITVVIGSLLLGLLKIAVPDLFSDIVTKVKSFLSI